MEIEIGDKLPNGATVLDRFWVSREPVGANLPWGLVLALWPQQKGNPPLFAAWEFSVEDGKLRVYDGDYHFDLRAALGDYDFRVAPRRPTVTITRLD